MFIVIVLIIAVIDIDNTLSFGSFPDKRFARFGPLYIPPHVKQSNKKNNIPPPVDDSRMCPLGTCYDADVSCSSFWTRLLVLSWISILT